MEACAIAANTRPESVSLRSVKDCRDRENIMAQIFDDTAESTQASVDLTIQMSSLEKMLVREMKTWWDLSTLRKYIDKEMIPRGLRLRKFPTTIYNEEFIKNWENTLTDCSCKLIKLIIHQEETILVEIRNEIESAQAAVAVHSQLEAFNTLDTRIKENLSKLEKSITEIKQRKFLRDIQDYKSDSVYNWKRNFAGRRTPKSILKMNANRKFNPSRVNFSSTEAESSDSPSEASDVVHTTPKDNQASSNRGGHTPSGRGKKSKNAERAGNTNATAQPRYPRRNKK